MLVLIISKIILYYTSNERKDHIRVFLLHY
jgi:hypothetical protein